MSCLCWTGEYYGAILELLGGDGIFLMTFILDCRSWQPRRVVVTKQIIAFSQKEKQVLVDAIPLAEVTAVRDLSGLQQRSEIWGSKRQSEPSFSGDTPSRTAKRLHADSDTPHSLFPAPNSAHTPSESNGGTGMSPQNALTIETVDGGHNSGRTYTLRAPSHERCRELVASIAARAATARAAAYARTRFRRSQERIRRVYVSKPFQFSVAILIVTVQP